MSRFSDPDTQTHQGLRSRNEKQGMDSADEPRSVAEYSRVAGLPRGPLFEQTWWQHLLYGWMPATSISVASGLVLVISFWGLETFLGSEFALGRRVATWLPTVCAVSGFCLVLLVLLRTYARPSGNFARLYLLGLLLISAVAVCGALFPALYLFEAVAATPSVVFVSTLVAAMVLALRTVQGRPDGWLLQRWAPMGAVLVLLASLTGVWSVADDLERAKLAESRAREEKLAAERAEQASLKKSARIRLAKHLDALAYARGELRDYASFDWSRVAQRVERSREAIEQLENLFSYPPLQAALDDVWDPDLTWELARASGHGRGIAPEDQLRSAWSALLAESGVLLRTAARPSLSGFERPIEFSAEYGQSGTLVAELAATSDIVRRDLELRMAVLRLIGPRADQPLGKFGDTLNQLFEAERQKVDGELASLRRSFVHNWPLPTLEGHVPVAVAKPPDLVETLTNLSLYPNRSLRAGDLEVLLSLSYTEARERYPDSEVGDCGVKRCQAGADIERCLACTSYALVGVDLEHNRRGRAEPSLQVHVRWLNRSDIPRPSTVDYGLVVPEGADSTLYVDRLMSLLCNEVRRQPGLTFLRHSGDRTGNCSEGFEFERAPASEAPGQSSASKAKPQRWRALRPVVMDLHDASRTAEQTGTSNKRQMIRVRIEPRLSPKRVTRSKGRERPPRNPPIKLRSRPR